mmetsp:Transcript_10235/g.18809  ORF Transcript_10235/g.18809 Transcript_10235/m.18809 type:complete len:466 (-) Transcript_10235:235-1632(-)
MTLRRCVAAVALMSTSVAGTGPAVSLSWSDHSMQFFLMSNLTQDPDPTDATLLQNGDPLDLRHDGATSNEKPVGRCSEPMRNWAMRTIAVEHNPYQYSIRVQGSGRFRLGLTPAKHVTPGDELYREWMVDSDGCWVVAGVPDSEIEMEGDSLWGAFGREDWEPTSNVVMHVDLDDGQVSFEDSTTSSITQKLEMSLDGFAPLSTKTTPGRSRERQDHISINQELKINSLAFQFEPANFGPSLPAKRAIKANLVLTKPLDACKTLFNQKELKGNVAYAARGGCDFLDKILHAQAAGATAVIVGDTEGSGTSSRLELIIMDHYNRAKDAEKVRIPSVFIANVAHKYVLAQQKKKEKIQINLRDAVSAPVHHGLHWRETGLVPAVWLAPGSSVTATFAEKRDPSKAVVCKPLSYIPLATSESSQNRAIGKTWTKSLVGAGTVCRTEAEKTELGNPMTQVHVSQILPWR